MPGGDHPDERASGRERDLRGPVHRRRRRRGDHARHGIRGVWYPGLPARERRLRPRPADTGTLRPGVCWLPDAEGLHLARPAVRRQLQPVGRPEHAYESARLREARLDSEQRLAAGLPGTGVILRPCGVDPAGSGTRTLCVGRHHPRHRRKRAAAVRGRRRDARRCAVGHAADALREGQQGCPEAQPQCDRPPERQCDRTRCDRGRHGHRTGDRAHPRRPDNERARGHSYWPVGASRMRGCCWYHAGVTRAGSATITTWLAASFSNTRGPFKVESASIGTSACLT